MVVQNSETLGRDDEPALLVETRRYLRAIEEGAVGDRLRAFFADDAVLRTLPNRLVPAGQTSDVAGILAAAERGQTVIREQRYDVRSAYVVGATVALEVDWSGTLQVSLGASPPGTRMRAAFAMFLTYRDGRITSQRNYDCFEPF